MRGLFLTGLLMGSVAAEKMIPNHVLDVLSDYCIDCHDTAEKKGGLNLDLESVDWSKQESRILWEKVLKANEQGLMPPLKKDQPSEEERKALMTWLDESLLENTLIGGTLPRRLSRVEYRNTIRQLFGLPEFELPNGFPRDGKHHGFDNLGEGLVTSPALLEAYSKVAWAVADELYPPKKALKIEAWTAGPEDMALSFSAAAVRDGALRLASRHEHIMRSCTWPSKIEVKTSGVYRITVHASTYKPKSKEPMILELRAREVSASERSSVSQFRVLKEISINSAAQESVTFEAELFEGQTLLFRWLNAEMTHDGKELEKQMREWFRRDPRYLAAWQKSVFPFPGKTLRSRASVLRGLNGWKTLKNHLADPKLDMSHATMESERTKKLLAVFKNGMTNVADAQCHYYFEHGPALEIHGLTMQGPLKVVDGPKDKRRDILRLKMAGLEKGSLSDEDYARKMLVNFLPRAFRRPVDKKTVESFFVLAKTHWQEGRSFEEGMHLLIRNVLISPRFLYRALEREKLDQHMLATRLAYFLTQGPPDATLRDLANRKRLGDSWVLKREAERLMPTKWNQPMVQSFTRQWLGTGLLSEIMPDPKLNFTPYYVEMARDEIEYSFAEILRENRPMTDFIDPDFSYMSGMFARNVYKVEVGKKGKLGSKADRKLRRVKLERGGRVGGLLGQSGIMMATANGVDTQPVLRGVWVLENILGSAPPPPPKNVPALTPDTQGTTNPREMLAAHTMEPSCASCHRRIDPMGIVLENFDPVGRWRVNWPKGAGIINASGTLPDGTSLENVVDLKRWLVENVNQFSECISAKLMTYATGRVPNHTEMKEIKEIVKANHAKGNGFRDLVLALIESETFRTK